jgi:transposase
LLALITAVVLVAEVGDFTRFAYPRQLMAYFGREQSSGETIRRGGITKTGNAHARRALVEGARQDRQRRQCRHRTRDGGFHLVDRLHGSIRAKNGMTLT